MSDIPRSYLKKNELADLAASSVKWAKENQSTFFSIAGTVALILVLSGFFFARYHALNRRADDKFNMGQGMLFQGQSDQGLATLSEIITQYPRSEAATKARLTKAEFLLEKKQYDEAEKAILPATENARPKIMIPLALSVLGTIREDAGKYKEAIAVQTALLDRYPEHFFAPRAYESLGRLYEITGQTADAKTTYEKLATLYPQSLWAQRAQERIAALASRGAPAASPSPAAPSPAPLAK